MSYEMKIPKALIGLSGHLNPKEFSLGYLQGPSHNALVLDGFRRICSTLQ